MTNDEIIKAFEICYGIDKVLGCTSCPLYDEESFCQRIDDVSLEEKVFDLINRQKAEIDILIRKKENLRDEICELQAEVERLTEALDGETVENMRLKHEIEILRTNNNSK